MKPVYVLLLDDNAVDAFFLEELLKESRTPFAVEHVRCVADAIERLAHGGVDIILSDLILPDSEGIETFQKLHEQAPDVPIIVLSGLSDETLAVETVDQGAQDYLVKGTFDAHLLIRSMRYALKRAEAERELSEERNLLRSVINNLPDAIYVKDIYGRFQLDNLAHQRNLGIHRLEEVLGKTVYDFYPPETAAKLAADDDAVIQTGKPVINRQEVFPNGDGQNHWISTTKVPLRNREGQIIGILGIGRDITARKRTEEQLANYNAELRQKNSQLEDDLDMASEIQQAFLPQQFPTFPKDVPAEESALGLCARYFPTGAVGGDFFHVLQLSDTQAGVFICDVMGHGVRAALVTAIERTLCEELTSVANHPGQFLTRMNQALLAILRRTRTPMFASAFYMFIDLEKRELRFANAGHPKPLLLRKAAGEVEVLAPSSCHIGSALGILDGVRYETCHKCIEEEDTLLLFTDGLFEVEGPEGEYFDQRRLIEAVRQRIDVSPEQLVEELIALVRRYSANQSFSDDVCLVAVELRRLGNALGVNSLR